MKGFITVEFQKNYCASRGAPIMGLKGDVQTIRSSDAVKELLDSEVLKAVKKGAAKRETAADKKGGETS